MVKLEPKQQAIILILAALIIFGGGYRLAQVNSREADNKLSLQQPAVEAGAGNKVKELAVHVSGAVARPGLYRVAQGARVADALDKAGPTEEADLNAINLAAALVDGQKVSVPFKGAANPLLGAAGTGSGGAQKYSSTFGYGSTASTAPGAGQSAGGQTGLININTAGTAELDTLPGIGLTLAQRIIQHREVNGPFKQIEDIKNVSGIGDKKFEDIKDRITVW